MNDLSANNITSDYIVSSVSSEDKVSVWHGEWRKLLAMSDSHQKLYQSPEFYDYLDDPLSPDPNKPELLVIRAALDNRVVGIVPIRKLPFDLKFMAGKFKLFSVNRQVVTILGSVPLLGDSPELLLGIAAILLRKFPDCAAVSLQSYPFELKHRLGQGGAIASHVVNGWRECYTIDLPADYSDYLNRFSAKKRYNVSRQIRLLEQAVGTVQLRRIAVPGDVQELMSCLRALGDQSNEKTRSQEQHEFLLRKKLALCYTLLVITKW